MKRLSIIILCAVGAMTFSSCQTEDGLEIKNTPAVDGDRISPMTDESGAVRAYEGNRVSVEGFNLDRVGLVTMADVEAPIVEASLQKLVFEIPELPEEYTQRDNPWNVELKIYDADAATVVYTAPYFVTVPITDAMVTGFSPAEGTVGTIITITGRNLDQLTEVIFSDVEVPDIEFIEQTADAVRVAVPAVSVSGAESEIDITVVWSEGELPVTSDGNKFILSIPVFDEYIPEGTLELDMDIELTGRNLDMVTGIRWGEFHFSVIEQSETAIKVNIPANMPEQDPAVATYDLIAEYGDVAASMVIAEDVSVDTSPIPLPAPELVSAVSSDPEYAGMYLGREVTVTGNNLFSISEVTVAGIKVDMTENSSTATEFRFVMPETLTGTEAKEVELKVTDTQGQSASMNITVYPFYYTKGLRLGIGSSSIDTYSDDARNYSFLMFDRGGSISAEQWYTEPADMYALSVDSGTQDVKNPVTSSLYTIAATATAEQYYSVQPYVYAASASSGDIDIFNPSGSANRISYHRYPGSTKLPETLGTPIVYMTVLNSDEDVKAAVSGGNLDDILMSGRMASRNTYVRHAKTESTSNWVVGSVILVQYVTYEHGLNGTKPSDIGDVRKQGYLYVKDLTCKTDENGKLLSKEEDNWSGYIEFDLYWSNTLN